MVRYEEGLRMRLHRDREPLSPYRMKKTISGELSRLHGQLLAEYRNTPSFEVRDEITELIHKIHRLGRIAYKLDRPEMHLHRWQKLLRLLFPFFFIGPEEHAFFWFRPR